ncbi:MAG: hypothetical protein A2758_01870 [Candidatus Zambryskibacteria bacterium RIFCSPHIGHO2_01_FULL_49_18]|uniref:Zn-dependent hydrolase of the beta-lactamase fold-like protein n=2 Tax=Candidatus Zambryskiibacteriota TaxID=1817925 RepID=A0A1G2T1P1_9BACT|nr:MAG: hypothetical protein A2758_01870 [Candidatus Zambryskibacteria bacterium RIFCSPHIGHO2_01_FULL_49_18]OHB05120.1 MAG: hypothetical protein A3A26_00755 [Candidatus Zambryskibacteria bacterium RIFCSPLOWO2_01_FULL_47_14]
MTRIFVSFDPIRNIRIMIISYQGLDAFKISQGDLAISVNPRAKVSADVTFFTGKKNETSEKSGFVIDGPGEYEIKDIFIKGFLLKEENTYKTTYLITFEGMKLCFLGSLEAPEEIEDVDILFVPVNADAAASYKLAVSLEPSVVIPMNYDKKALEQFVKEGGEKVEPIEKLVVKKKDLEGKEGEIVILREE